MHKSSETPSRLRIEPYFETDLANFAGRYSPSSISPRTMVKLSGELLASGHLTREQHDDLSFQSELMPNFEFTIGALTGEKPEPERPRDYVEIWRQRLEFEENHAADGGRMVRRTQEILTLLQSIEKQPAKSQALATLNRLSDLNKLAKNKKAPTAKGLTLELPPLRLR